MLDISRRRREAANPDMYGHRLQQLKQTLHKVLREIRLILREMRRRSILLLILFCGLTAVPAAIQVTPGQHVQALNQDITVKAAPFSLSIPGYGELVPGNQAFDIRKIEVYGPLRPRLELDLPLKRGKTLGDAVNPATAGPTQAAAAKTIEDGFVQWFKLSWMYLISYTLGLSGFLAFLVLLTRKQPRRAIALILGSLICASTFWTSSAALAVVGSQPLTHVKSLDDLVGHTTLHLVPKPDGPKLHDYPRVVIGDSRFVRVGGPPLKNGTASDKACERSADSLSVDLTQATGQNVLNLACPGASIPEGLMGEQTLSSGYKVPAQVAIVEQMEGLNEVDVGIGPNDVWWADGIGNCYFNTVCNDNLTQPNYQALLAQFRWNYDDLLQTLSELSGSSIGNDGSKQSHPKVVIILSYNALDDHATCKDTKGPPGTPGLDPSKIDMLTSRNNDINTILIAGAKAYHFDVALPRLNLLCPLSPTLLAPDIQGVHDSHPFHPTDTGEMRIAMAVLAAYAP